MKQLNEYVIVSDFDGTISLEDSNYNLVLMCGNAGNMKIEEDFLAGKVSNREAFEQHFDVMRISLSEYENFIRTNINIDPTFDEFLEYVHTSNIPLFILSAGFRQGIEYVMGEERLKGVEVLANDLSGAPHISPTFATKNPNCNKKHGPCGNCKRECIETIRKDSGKKIIFIGDGITDRCAIENADIVYAKDSLAERCDEQGIAYTPYNNFADVMNHLAQMATMP